MNVSASLCVRAESPYVRRLHQRIAASLLLAACLLAPVEASGCFLMSPFRRGTSRLAIGSHLKFGFGLYAVGFAMALPVNDPTAAVLVRAGGQDVSKIGRMVANELFLIPLSQAEAVVNLRELREVGVLWLFIRETWLAHSGQAAAAAIGSYESHCTGIRSVAS